MSILDASHSYYNYKDDTPASILRLDRDCIPFKVKVPISRNWKSARMRVLLVTQHVDTADLRAKKLGTDASGRGIRALLKLAEQYIRPFCKPKYATAIINFNYFKTYHIHDAKLRETCNAAATERVRSFIEKIKPHKVIVLGDEAARYLITTVSDPERYRGHKFVIDGIEYFSTIDIIRAFSSGGQESEDEVDDWNVNEKKVEEANLLGYAGRCVGAALLGRLPYTIDVKVNPVVIDTLPKFKKFFAHLMKAKRVALDSETEDLSRVTNRILTLQFAFSPKTGYILPLYHKDSPFTKSELEYIRARLREFFGRKIDYLEPDYYSRYIIGQNLKFDSSPLRHWLQLNTIYWPYWDLMAGEYALDENIKVLQDYGTPQYNLQQMALNYGCLFYEKAKFSKSDRGSIATEDLKGPVLEYMAADVQIPFAIHQVQQQRADNQPYGKDTYGKAYRKFILTQMSNMIHIESQMEQRGVQLDINHLMLLKSKNGPIEKLKREKLDELKKSKAAQKANARILKKMGMPTNSLFDAVSGKKENDQWVLELTKPAHKRALFIEELRLEPLSYGKMGEPSINKAFLNTYKDVKEVAIFREYGEVEKLSNTYVNKFVTLYRTDKDFRTDNRLRPSYGFVDTVTGRSNSYDPNLQQIPTRGKYAKLIKRLFVAAKNHLSFKLDYSSHEVRIWGITSKDFLLCDLFTRGRNLRIKYRKTEYPKLRELIDTVGDIHKLNCQFFLNVDPKDVTKEQRDAIKSVVFGSIYGRSARSIAGQIGQNEEYVEKLLRLFFKRYFKAAQWLEWSKDFTVENNYVYSPIGRVRHQYAHLYGLNSLIGDVRRRGCNAPIQSLGADFGHTAARLFSIHLERVFDQFQLWDSNLTLPGGISVMVHDSIHGEAQYRFFLMSLQILQWCATLGCEQYYNKHFGLEFPTHLEVEFEIGCDDSRLIKWDWSESQLKDIIQQSLEYQKEIYPDINVKEALKQIYAVRNNVELMRYLDKNYPILGE